MTPKEKAKELVGKFIEHTKDWDELDGYVVDEYRAKQCALIAVDEILKIEYWAFMEMGGGQEEEYWQQVKNEINLL